MPRKATKAKACNPARELGCRILAVAVQDWRRSKPGGPIRAELTTFFKGPWCDYLWTSLMDKPLDEVLDALGVV